MSEVIRNLGDELWIAIESDKPAEEGNVGEEDKGLVQDFNLCRGILPKAELYDLAQELVKQKAESTIAKQ